MTSIDFREKTKEFPNFYYITLEDSVERHKFMQDQFEKYGINGTPYFTKRFVDMNPPPTLVDYKVGMSIKALGISISFINCLKHWYDNTNEEYAIFGEDDDDFSSIEYWNFTWKEFIDNLPADWECVQLMKVLDPIGDKFWNELKLQIEYGRFWGSLGLMRRSWVKKVLDRHLIADNVYNMYMTDVDFCTAENMLFWNLGTIYNVPLFHENNNVPASITKTDYNYILNSTGHRVCEMVVRDFWKFCGPSLTIQQLLSMNPFKHKLAGFPTVYYTSLVESEDRREFMRNQFQKYGISHKPFLTKRLSDITPQPKISHNVDISTNNAAGVCIGHLDNLKQWYDTTDEEYAIFCEDDHDFSSIDHWPFTWKEFVDNLPKDWGCIQLIRIIAPIDGFFDISSHDDIKQDLNLKIKYGRWWGTAALMKRSWVKKVLDRHIQGDTYNLEVPGYECFVENNLFYAIDVLYNFPLLTENNSFNSTVKWTDINQYIEGKMSHKVSEKIFKKLWEKVNPEAKIEEFLRI